MYDLLFCSGGYGTGGNASLNSYSSQQSGYSSSMAVSLPPSDGRSQQQPAGSQPQPSQTQPMQQNKVTYSRSTYMSIRVELIII